MLVKSYEDVVPVMVAETERSVHETQKLVTVRALGNTYRGIVAPAASHA